MADNKSEIEEFLEFQSQSLDYLYDIMPTADDSLFIASIDGLEAAKYRVKSVKFSLPKISYEWDESYLRSFPKSVTSSDEVTIEWFEDAFDSVTKFHYSKMSDTALLASHLFKVGGAGMLNVTINKYAFKEGNLKVDTPFDSVAIPVVTSVIKLNGLKVIDVGDISFDHTASGEMKVVSIKYVADSIVWSGRTSMADQVSSEDFHGLRKTEKIL